MEYTKEQIEEMAENCGNTSQILSDFPHHKRSVEYGFVKGFQKCQELIPKWIELPAKELLPIGYYAIIIRRDEFENVIVEEIKNGIIPYHYATHYCKIFIPSPPNK